MTFSRFASLACLLGFLGCDQSGDQGPVDAAAIDSPPVALDASADGASPLDVPSEGSAACAACPAPHKGTAVCDQEGRCGAQCPRGTRLCGGVCQLDDLACSETCGWVPRMALSCGRLCVADTPDSCCSLKACGAFGCKNNRCLTGCQDNSDCAEGLACNAATGQCGPCGQLDQPCCWNSDHKDYDCSDDAVFCNAQLTCITP